MSKETMFADPNDLKIIGLDTDDDEKHPLWDPRIYLELDESLVKNIMVYGVKQSVLVRQEAGVYFVVDGRQRVRCAREAMKRQGEAGEVELRVPIRVEKADDQRISGIMISLNELRKADEILEKSEKVGRLLDYGRTIEEVAIMFGKTETTIRSWLKLVEADPRIKEAVRTGQISASAGIEIADFPKADQAEKLEAYLRSLSSKPDGKGPNPASSNSIKKDRKQQLGKTSKQTGIKRTWLRKALATNAAKDLNDERLAVLEWFATGKSGGGRWFDDFAAAVKTELEG